MNKELEKMKYGGYSDLLISKQNEIEKLQQELQRKDNIIKFIKQFINDNCWGYAGIDEDGINILLDKIKKLEK